MADTPKPKPEEKLNKDAELISENKTDTKPTSAPDLPGDIKLDAPVTENKEDDLASDSGDLSAKDAPEEVVDNPETDNAVEDIELDETKAQAEDAKTTQEALDDTIAGDSEKPTAGDAFKTPEEAAAEDASLPDAQPVAPAAMPVKPNKSFKHWVKAHKKTTIFVILVIIIAVLAAVPWTRYKIAGTFLRQTQTIQVLDSETNKPVTGAFVFVGDRSKTTDSKGKVTLNPKVGSQDVVVQKPNFKTSTSKQLVPILKPKKDITVHLKATGRQVSIKVVNGITGKAVEDADISTASSHFKTDAKGEAVIVAPADSKELDATITANNYIATKAKLQVNAQTLQIQTFKLTPTGKVYFLSNLSGKLDVVKSNLDGTDRQTVLAGTGNEDTKGTALLASRDWKYLALLSRRDGGKSDKIFLINTSNDKVSTIDEGDNISFTLVGWDNHNFAYTVYRNAKQQWEPGRQVIKSYNAESSKLITLDENEATGNQSNSNYQVFSSPYITDSGLVYGTYWDTYYFSQRSGLAGKFSTIRTIGTDGKNKKDLKTFDATTTGNVYLRSYAPNEVYVRLFDFDKNGNSYYEYEDGSVKETKIDENAFSNASYPTYLLSPSGKQTFWAENRDGKNSLFVGDAQGKNQQQIATLSDYSAYGWFSDDYLLVAKNGSELYIMPKSGGTPIKVTDYYKPNLDFAGYGYGYGGL